MEATDAVLRQRSCRWGGCGTVFWICRSCDRGQHGPPPSRSTPLPPVRSLYYFLLVIKEVRRLMPEPPTSTISNPKSGNSSTLPALIRKTARFHPRQQETESAKVVRLCVSSDLKASFADCHQLTVSLRVRREITRRMSRLEFFVSACLEFRGGCSSPWRRL